MTDNDVQRSGYSSSGNDPLRSQPLAAPARAMILVRIEDFKAVRRKLGVEGAETLTTAIAERVAAMLPDAATRPIGRATIEVGVTVQSQAELDALVRDIDRFPLPTIVGGLTIPLRLEIGAALATDCRDDVELVEAAERALARAKAVEPCLAVVARPTVNADDAAIGGELIEAIDNGDLFLQYQPKLHLRRQAITSIEALIRWRHPVRGLVMPNDFIPAAERSGAIRAMTLWTLRQVTADQRVIRAAGHELPVFVNIAGVLLSDASFVEEAAALIVDSGVDIGFEITETSVIRDPQAAITNLQRLADIGVAITIDDYGAGLSSLAYLKQLPARELKIDKLFVTQLSSSHRDPLIVRSTIDLAHALEMEVVAEGVETPTSLALLSVMGCDMVQGFLISRPLVLNHLLGYLRDQAHRELLEQSRSPLRRLAAVGKSG